MVSINSESIKYNDVDNFIFYSHTISVTHVTHHTVKSRFQLKTQQMFVISTVYFTIGPLTNLLLKKLCREISFKK